MIIHQPLFECALGSPHKLDGTSVSGGQNPSRLRISCGLQSWSAGWWWSVSLRKPSTSSRPAWHCSYSAHCSCWHGGGRSSLQHQIAQSSCGGGWLRCWHLCQHWLLRQWCSCAGNFSPRSEHQTGHITVGPRNKLGQAARDRMDAWPTGKERRNWLRGINNKKRNLYLWNWPAVQSQSCNVAQFCGSWVAEGPLACQLFWVLPLLVGTFPDNASWLRWQFSDAPLEFWELPSCLPLVNLCACKTDELTCFTILHANKPCEPTTLTLIFSDNFAGKSNRDQTVV